MGSPCKNGETDCAKGCPCRIQGSLRYAAIVVAFAALVSGCSLRSMAIDRLGDALSSGGSSFGRDDDPELVRAAVPFSLKVMESLLDERPAHSGLRMAAASGFTQYAYAFIQQEADELEDVNGEAAARLNDRARRLYLRARDHAVTGLSADVPGFREGFLASPRAALRSATAEHVPLLYWAAVSWAASISLSKNDPDLIADLPYVEAIIERVLELDEKYEHGAIQAFLITYGPLQREGSVDVVERAKKLFDRAVELTGGAQAGPYVSFAEAIMVPAQDKVAFAFLLEQALAVNVDARPEWRLANLVMQRRARWLLSRSERLFYASSDPGR